MQLSVTSGQNGLIQRSTFLAFGDALDHSTSWPLNSIVTSLNRAVHKISILIWQSVGTWQWDDTNQTDLPIATTTLVNSQQDYTLPTTVFQIFRVEILDASGIWHKLDQIDKSIIRSAEIEYYKTDGLPVKYDILANSILLYPSPATASVTLAAGLRIHISREATEFTVPATYTTSDTTQPGFDEQFHELLCYYAARDFCVVNGPTDRGDRYNVEITVTKQDLVKHYGMKNMDKPPKFVPRREFYN